jgi:hypothetical protein
VTHALPLAFVCPGKFSFGELQNAITIAKQLPADIRPEFLVADQYLGLVQRSGISARSISGSPGNRNAALTALQELDPAGVVVADHHLFALERTTFSLESVLLLDRPAVALDSLCLGPSASTMRMALSQQPAMEPIHRWFPPETEVPELPGGMTMMRPVPVAGLSRPEDSFDLYGKGLRPKRTREDVFHRLGISGDRSLVVAAQSNWATSAYGLLGRVSKTANPETYQGLRNRWSAEMFSRVGRPVTVLEVSSRATAATHHGDVEFLSCPYQPLDDFVDILAAADLYITDNLTSGAMAKAAALGTATLALVNESNDRSDDPFSKAWFAEMESNFPGFDVRFLVNPFGWTDELAPLLADNPYLAALPKAEIYDLQASAEAIREHLGVRFGPASQALAHQVAKLPAAVTILRERLNL